MSHGTPFFVYEHPVDGCMSLSLVGNTVVFSCRWPFDLSTDEWINIKNEFDHRTYVTRMATLLEKGEVRIEGIRSGYIAFTVLPGGKINLDVLNNMPESPVGFIYSLAATPEELVPLKSQEKKL